MLSSYPFLGKIHTPGCYKTAYSVSLFRAIWGRGTFRHLAEVNAGPGGLGRHRVTCPSREGQG